MCGEKVCVCVEKCVCVCGEVCVCVFIPVMLSVAGGHNRVKIRLEGNERRTKTRRFFRIPGDESDGGDEELVFGARERKGNENRPGNNTTSSSSIL